MTPEDYTAKQDVLKDILAELRDEKQSIDEEIELIETELGEIE